MGAGWLLHQRRAYQSLRKWELSRLNQRHDQAEALRNGLLQDLFGLQRNLELLLMQQNLLQSTEGKQLLVQLQQAANKVEHCSDRLSSPYDLAQDGASLPLALRHVLQRFEACETSISRSNAQFHSVQLNLDFPQQWPSNTSLGSLLLPGLVEQVTERCGQSDRDSANAAPHLRSKMTIDARLVQEKQAVFTLCLSPPISITVDSQQDAEKLCQAFQLLSGGHCQVKCSGETETWRFAWS